MKKYVTVAMAAILMIATAQAQHINIGVKAGLNVYNIHDDKGADYNPKNGFNAGLIGHIHLTKQLALQPEILYSGQGAKYSTSGVETTIKMDYINVPVLVQYMFDNGFRLQAGPQVGFLVSAKSETNNVSTDFKSNLKSVDFSLGMGVGYVFVPTGFGVDARYNLGLSDISTSSLVKSTNRGFQIGVFYLFDHK